jgi:hypothetical protein
MTQATCTLQKRNRKKKFSYTGSTGTPAVGQTITGGTSLKTAVIDKVATGYLVVKTLSGTFTTGETVTVGSTPSFTFSATLSAQADYQNQSGEYEYYWSNDQTSVPCDLYYLGGGGKGVTNQGPGEVLDQPLKCALPDSCTVDALEYRVVSTVTGYTGTFDIANLYPRSRAGAIDHYEAVLKKVTS